MSRKLTVKEMVQQHFKTERGLRQLKRGPYREKWANAAMSVALFAAVQ